MLKRKLWSMARNSELSLGKHSCTFLLGRLTVSLSRFVLVNCNTRQYQIWNLCDHMALMVFHIYITGMFCLRN